MTTISKLLVACAAMTFAATQAGAGELLVNRCGRLSLPLRAALCPRLRAMALSTSRVGAAGPAAAILRAAVSSRSRCCDCRGAGRRRAAADPARHRGARGTPATAAGRAATPPKCGSAGCAKCPAARGGGPATGRAAAHGGRATTGSPAARGHAARRRTRRHSRQFGQQQSHHASRDRGCAHRLVREPWRRAAVRQAAGAMKAGVFRLGAS